MKRGRDSPLNKRSQESNAGPLSAAPLSYAPPFKYLRSWTESFLLGFPGPRMPTFFAIALNLQLYLKKWRKYICEKITRWMQWCVFELSKSFCLRAIYNRREAKKPKIFCTKTIQNCNRWKKTGKFVESCELSEWRQNKRSWLSYDLEPTAANWTNVRLSSTVIES